MKRRLVSNEQVAETEEECPVCFENIEGNDFAWCASGHKICKACANTLCKSGEEAGDEKARCPVCRQGLLCHMVEGFVTTLEDAKNFFETVKKRINKEKEGTRSEETTAMLKTLAHLSRTSYTLKQQHFLRGHIALHMADRLPQKRPYYLHEARHRLKDALKGPNSENAAKILVETIQKLIDITPDEALTEELIEVSALASPQGPYPLA